MQQQITVGVYRRLDNRLQGDIDDSSTLAWELHRRRAGALEEAFNEVDIRVVNWGDTYDSERTHELVQVLVEVGVAVAAAVPATAILKWIGGVLGTILNDAAAESAKGLIARLRRKQEGKQIADFSIFAKGRPLVTVYPDDLSGQVTATLPDGRVVTTTWSAAAADLPKT
jgi:hypothetical protein